MLLPIAPLLGESNRLLLRAATAPDALAVPAFLAWRERVDFDHVGGPAHRVMPALARLAARNGIDDPDLNRIRGIERHVWAANALKLKHVLAAIETLNAAGIRPMMLKGGALFARLPELAARRTAADYDILLPPGRFREAAAALASAGFTPLAMSWAALTEDNDHIDTSGTALVRGGRDSLVDLHWRPLTHLYDPVLTEELFNTAEPAVLGGAPVLVPGVTQHLFVAIARCDPPDRMENFQRLVEGQMLLAGVGAERVDWVELAALTRRYGLEAMAASYLHELRTSAELQDLGAVAAEARRKVTMGSWLEMTLRMRAASYPAAWRGWFVSRREKRFNRSGTAWGAPSLGEAALRAVVSIGGPGLGSLRRLMLADLNREASDGDEFLDGWYYWEPDGRWSNGQLAGLVLPLTEAQRNGEKVLFRGHLMPGRRGWARIAVNGGGGSASHLQVGQAAEFELRLVVRPEPKLGGAGLVLFSTPDATSPQALGHSTDSRRLGYFLKMDPSV